MQLVITRGSGATSTVSTQAGGPPATARSACLQPQPRKPSSLLLAWQAGCAKLGIFAWL